MIKINLNGTMSSGGSSIRSRHSDVSKYMSKSWHSDGSRHTVKSRHDGSRHSDGLRHTGKSRHDRSCHSNVSRCNDRSRSDASRPPAWSSHDQRSRHGDLTHPSYERPRHGELSKTTNFIKALCNSVSSVDAPLIVTILDLLVIF